MSAKSAASLLLKVIALQLLIVSAYVLGVEGIPHKYLLKANSSVVITQMHLDGSNSLATVYVSDNFKKTVSTYGRPVIFPPSVHVEPTAKPDVGNVVFYERIPYCFSGDVKKPLLVHVNESQTRVVTSEMNSLPLTSCQQITTADIDGDGSEEFVVVAVDHSKNTASVVVFENIDHSPTKTKELYRVQLDGASSELIFRLTAGNFNHDQSSTEQIAVISYDKTSSVKLWVLGMTGSHFGAIAAQHVVTDTMYSYYDPCVPMDTVVAYLNDDGGKGGISTLIVAYQDDIVGVTVKISIKSYQIKGNKLIETSTTVSKVSPSAPPVNISLSIGQIETTSTQDTVVMSMGPYNGPFHVYALSATNGVLDGHTLWTYIGDESTFAVARQTNAAVLPQSNMIAVMDTYSTEMNTIEQKLHLLTVIGSSIEGKIVKKWTNSPYSYGYVTGGNFVGLNVYLGPETHYTASDVSNTLAFLEAPPYHYKFKDAYYGDPLVSWTTTTSKTTTVTVKSTQSWTSSDTFKFSAGLFDSSISHNIIKQTQNMVDKEYQKQVEFTQELKVETSFDEVLIVRRVTFDITEIPVYIGKKPSGHILIVQPVDMQGNTVFITVGSRLYFNSSHVIGDVRTYPWDAPKNINYSIYNASGTVAVRLDFDFTVTSSDMTGHEKSLTHHQSTQVEDNLDLKFPFNVEGGVSGSLGFSYDHSDTYENTQVNTSQTQITESVQISLYIPGYSIDSGDNPLQYDVYPYLYWDPSGKLHISWAVGLPKNEWNNYISHPDPAFCIPYIKTTDAPVVKDLIFELYTTPRGIPDDGSSVLINVVLHNYSFRPSLGTTVEFYWTDTSKIPPNLKSDKKWSKIGNKEIPTIGGFSNESTFISWYPEKGLKSAILIVKLLSSGTDFDEDNNIGYSVWPQDSNNPLRLSYLLKHIGFSNVGSSRNIGGTYNEKFTDELTDIGAIAKDLLFKKCTGKRIGLYYHKSNCLHQSGRCCSANVQGTSRSSKADESNAFCGHCFTGQLKLDSKEMGDDDYFSDIMTLLTTKQCSGRKIGKYTHMHNCFQRGGRCCSTRSDGTGNPRKVDSSQRKCGYCFTGRPKSSEGFSSDTVERNIESTYNEKFTDELTDIEAIAEDLSFKKCTGERIGLYYHKSNCHYQSGRCCSANVQGTSRSSKADESNAFCGHCFTGQLKLDSKEMGDDDYFSDIMTLLTTKQCSGRKIGKYTHMHNCFQRGGRCCSTRSDGTGNPRKVDSSQRKCGYCFTGRPKSSEGFSSDTVERNIESTYNEKFTDELTDIEAIAEDLSFKKCTGERIGLYYHKSNCLYQSGRCCSANVQGTSRSSKADESNAFCGHCFTGQLKLDSKEMGDDYFSDIMTLLTTKQCSGRKIGKYTHMHNCFQRGGRCCSTRSDGTGNPRKVDSSQRKCGYCFTGRPKSSEDEEEHNTNDYFDDVALDATKVYTGRKIGYY